MSYSSKGVIFFQRRHILFPLQVLVKVARAINPSVEIGPMSAPSVLVPVVAMAQVTTSLRRQPSRSFS